MRRKASVNEPACCSDCRQKRRRARNDRGEREMFTVICDQCGIETQIPFRPTNGRPV